MPHFRTDWPTNANSLENVKRVMTVTVFACGGAIALVLLMLKSNHLRQWLSAPRCDLKSPW